MPTAITYNTTDTVTTLIESWFVSTDPRRLAWEAMAAGDQTVLAVQATAMIDAPLWLGIPAEAEQASAWPRRWARGRDYVDADPYPAPDAPVASIPSNVALAHAIQCAALALRASGIDAGRDVEEAANRGVVSHSGGGHAESIDGDRANQPWSKLDTDAQRLLIKYRAAAVGVY